VRKRLQSPPPRAIGNEKVLAHRACMFTLDGCLMNLFITVLCGLESRINGPTTPKGPSGFQECQQGLGFNVAA
jgi:hypothetical protein